MKGKDMLDALGGIREEYVEAATEASRTPHLRWTTFVSAAACLLLMTVLVFFMIPKTSPEKEPGTASEMPTDTVLSSTSDYEEKSAEEAPAATNVSSMGDISAMIFDGGILYAQFAWDLYEGEIPTDGIKAVTGYAGGCYSENGGVPTHEGECNFDPELTTRYFRIDDARIAVTVRGSAPLEWIIFYDQERVDEFYPPKQLGPEYTDPTYGMDKSN